jgi:hypothetical protein
MRTGSLGTTAALFLSFVGYLVLSGKNDYQNKKELGIAVQTGGLDKSQRKSDYSEQSDSRRTTRIPATNFVSKCPSSKMRLHDPGNSTLHEADINQHER